MSQAGASRGGPTPRRVGPTTRSATRSVAASQDRSIAASTVTPSRAGRKALPKVKPRDSRAYGSSTRATEAEQLTLPVTGFAQAFDAQRDTAVARDESVSSDEDIDEILDELAAHGTRSRPRATAPTPINVNVVNRSSAANDASPDPSLLDTSKSFGMEREAGMARAMESTTIRTQLGRTATPSVRRDMNGNLPAAGRPPAPLFRSSVNNTQAAASAGIRQSQTGTRPLAFPPRRPTARDPSPPDDDRQQPRFQFSDYMQVLHSEWSRWWREIMLVLGAILFALVAYFLASSGFFGAVMSRAAHTWHGVVDWIQPSATPSTPSTPIYTPKPVAVDHVGTKIGEPGYKPIWDRVFELEDHADDFKPRIETLENSYGAVVPRITSLEDRAAEFGTSLNRLRDHLPPVVVVTRRADNSLEIPDEFWRAIQSRIEAEGGLSEPDISGESDWKSFINKNEDKLHRLLSEEVKKSPIKDSFKAVSEDEFRRLMQQEYVQISNMVDKKVATAIKGISSKIREAAAHDYLDETRIKSLALANLLANVEVNLRKVNYFSTGLGARIDPRGTSPTFIPRRLSIKESVYRVFLDYTSRRPPIWALEKWDEPGDCWCAAPDDKGLGLAQIAVQLGYEMLPRQVTVEHLPKQASIVIGTAPKDMELWVESNEQSAEADGCGPRPASGWICLGIFSYNVHGQNHVQTFNLDGIVTTPISRAIVRVTQNWGESHTCIYRLRLHGDRAE